MDRIVSDTPHFMTSLFAVEEGTGVIKVAIVAFGMASTYLFDSPSEIQNALGAGLLVLVDTITGIMVAVKKRKPRSSAKLSRVLTKLFGYLSVVAVAAVCSKAVPGLTLPIVDAVLWLVIATEGLSILENADALGLGRFAVLKKLLGTFSEGSDEVVEAAVASVKAAEKSEAAAVASVKAANIAVDVATASAVEPKEEE
ncbi:MAG: phage holin family protein [Pyrinomonadaceae bacterium]